MRRSRKRWYVCAYTGMFLIDGELREQPCVGVFDSASRRGTVVQWFGSRDVAETYAKRFPGYVRVAK